MSMKEYILIRNDHHIAPNRVKKSICKRKNYNINFIARIGLELRFLRCGDKKCHKKRFFFAGTGLGEGNKTRR